MTEVAEAKRFPRDELLQNFPALESYKDMSGIFLHVDPSTGQRLPTIDQRFELLGGRKAVSEQLEQIPPKWRKYYAAVLACSVSPNTDIYISRFIRESVYLSGIVGAREVTSYLLQSKIPLLEYANLTCIELGEKDVYTFNDFGYRAIEEQKAQFYEDLTAIGKYRLFGHH